MGYKHKYVSGEVYSFYNNSDDLEDNANFASWRMDIVHADTFIQVYTGVATIIKDIISGSEYRFYIEDYQFPSINIGCYKFIIIDTSASDQVLYISEEFEVVESTATLQYIKYRNGKNILNFNYETLPDYYSKYHIETFNRKPLRPTVSEGYALSDGTFKRVRTILTKTYEFITGWFDENEHDAMQAAIIHTDMQIVINNELTAVETEQEVEYTLEFEENYEFIQASVRLEVEARASTNKAL